MCFFDGKRPVCGNKEGEKVWGGGDDPTSKRCATHRKATETVLQWPDLATETSRQAPTGIHTKGAKVF